MRRILLKIYSLYGLVVFALIFLVLLPLFLLVILVPRLGRLASLLNHTWARLFFFFLFLNRTQVRFEEKLDPKQRYIFCANHTSFLDIPTMGLIGHHFKFIGKASLRKVPVWGYMYSKLHILVDRANMRSRHASWMEAKKALKKGYSIVFFPEGGILTRNPPKMVAFKDGSFRIAVDEQIPIVPVTIPFNHILLPDLMPLIMHPGKVVMKVHKPIWPTGTDDVAVKTLRQSVRAVIEGELDRIYTV